MQSVLGLGRHSPTVGFSLIGNVTSFSFLTDVGRNVDNALANVIPTVMSLRSVVMRAFRPEVRVLFK